MHSTITHLFCHELIYFSVEYMMMMSSLLIGKPNNS